MDRYLQKDKPVEKLNQKIIFMVQWINISDAGLASQDTSGQCSIERFRS
jgi:hypothetical protein